MLSNQLFNKYRGGSTNPATSNIKLFIAMKYRRHSSINAIQDLFKGSSFSFSTVEKVDVIREIKNLSKKKTIYLDDISNKIPKENVNFFAEYIFIFCNNVITFSEFPSYLKIANVNLISKIFQNLISLSLFRRESYQTCFCF